MTPDAIKETLSQDKLQAIFPRERADEFFDALFGDASEGAYDIELAYRDFKGNQLTMELRLNQRANRCLACNLTQGLPQVFSRHPIINVNGVVAEIDKLLGDSLKCTGWKLDYTEQLSQALHIVPLLITVEKN